MLYFISILLLLIIVLMVYVSLEMRDSINQVNTLIKKQSFELCLLKNKIKETPTPKAQNITITQYSPSNLEDIEVYVDSLEQVLCFYIYFIDEKQQGVHCTDFIKEHKGLALSKEKNEVLKNLKRIIKTLV